MFVQISTDNQIKSDAESNARLEEQVRTKLKRFEQRLTHVEVHIEDVNGHKGGDADKRVSLEARPSAMSGSPRTIVYSRSASGSERSPRAESSWRRRSRD